MSTKATPVFEGDGDTRDRILNTATKLFALKGFKAVTLKEIAKAVGIKIASIYYYYADKDALIENVLSRFEEVYRSYHSWLALKNQDVESVEEVMDNLFNQEFLEKLSPVSRFGMSMLLKEQHNHDLAARCAFEHIYQDGIRNIQDGFDTLVEKKLIPPTDTRTLASLFMFCVIAGNEVRLHEFTEMEVPIDCVKAYTGLRKLMTAALTQGLLEPGKPTV